jgi:protein phosphatase
VLLLAAFGGALLYWISTQWYVGEYEGRVAIYQGVPADIGPISLSRLTQETAIPVSDLPVLDQESIERSILVDSQEAAISTVAALDARAQECRSDDPPEGCPAAATEAEPTPAESPSAGSS